MDETVKYEVPHDGAVEIGIPAYRSCGVYLFNIVKLRSENEPFKTWNIVLSHQGKVVRKLSLAQLRQLPTDAGGYHLMRAP